MADMRFALRPENPFLVDVPMGECMTTIVGHADYVCCALKLADGRLVSGSNDCTLKIWDITSGICLMTLSEHENFVSCALQLADGRLVSGSGDGTLKIWNIKALQQQRWERRRYFLLLVDACVVLSATPQDPLLLRRRRDVTRLEQLYLFVLHTTNFQLLIEGAGNLLVVRPSMIAVFENLGIVRTISDFL